MALDVTPDRLMIFFFSMHFDYPHCDFDFASSGDHTNSTTSITPKAMLYYQIKRTDGQASKQQDKNQTNPFKS